MKSFSLKNSFSKLIKSSRSGFTLLELIVVIGIVAILGTVSVIVLNPAQMFKQTRDINRITDIQNINNAMVYYQATGGSSFGSHNIIYVSLPDTSSTCANLTLPTPPGGWSYACKPSSSYRNINGTGWIPVDFTSAQGTVGALFSALPIDPVNTLSGDYYYTYIYGTWTLSATMESTKYIASKTTSDGGSASTRFEVGNDLSLNTNIQTGGGAAPSFAATGGTITTSGGYTIHTFTSTGTFTVTAGSGNVETLVVAGGGGGSMGGGGGAGAVRTATIAVTTQAYSITVGTGGNGAVADTFLNGIKGNNSVFPTLTSEGGGYGAHQGNLVPGGNGGSGGGGGYGGAGGTASAGGNTGGGSTQAAERGSGGGGGAGAAGAAGTTAGGGNGGNGIASSLSGVSVTYGGGGGGGNYSLAGTNGTGGTGGGGAAGAPSTTNTSAGTSGTANTGGGGGGGSGASAGGAGGSVIVIIRYLTP